jgi:hypothetical protein
MANISSISTKWTITTHLTSLNTKKDHDIWPWKSRSLLGTSQKACNFIFWMLVYCHVEMYSTFQWFTWQVLPFITKVCMFYHSQINFSSPDSLDHVWYCYHLIFSEQLWVKRTQTLKESSFGKPLLHLWFLDWLDVQHGLSFLRSFWQKTHSLWNCYMCEWS